MERTLISVTTSCFNEEENLSEFIRRIDSVFSTLSQYDYELIIADNCSTDSSRLILRAAAKQNVRVKLIFNSANFGVIRSPYNALLAARGNAVVALACDLEEPPELIPQLLRGWESGARIVFAVKDRSPEGPVLRGLKNVFYKLLERISDTPQVRNFTGFGLYDRRVVDAFRSFDERLPFFRGLVGEVGFSKAVISYDRPLRKHGLSKNNYFSLYEQAVHGLVSHSLIPLRIGVIVGFSLSILSLAVAGAYFIYKVLFWDSFSMGIAPIAIGLFFFGSVQLMFIGVLGEYIGAIWARVKNRPVVIEEERINF